MSAYCIHIKVEPYVADWLKQSHGDPVVMLKDSPESRLVKLFLEKQPLIPHRENLKEFNVAIEIPYYKDKDPRVYNYLPPKAKKMVAECYETLFLNNLWAELNNLTHLNCSITNLIYAWMEKHGISEEHWETIRQKYYRLRKRYHQEKNIKL